MFLDSFLEYTAYPHTFASVRQCKAMLCRPTLDDRHWVGAHCCKLYSARTYDVTTNQPLGAHKTRSSNSLTAVSKKVTQSLNYHG